MKSITYMLLIHAFVNVLVDGSKIQRCPRIECSDDDVATDEDDWCLRVNYFDERAKDTTVQMRRCTGAKKGFCEWGMPNLHNRFIWPFN